MLFFFFRNITFVGYFYLDITLGFHCTLFKRHGILCVLLQSPVLPFLSTPPFPSPFSPLCCTFCCLVLFFSWWLVDVIDGEIHSGKVRSDSFHSSSLISSLFYPSILFIESTHLSSILMKYPLSLSLSLFSTLFWSSFCLLRNHLTPCAWLISLTLILSSSILVPAKANIALFLMVDTVHYS